jgi:hypothetical protein
MPASVPKVFDGFQYDRDGKQSSSVKIASQYDQRNNESSGSERASFKLVQFPFPAAGSIRTQPLITAHKGPNSTQSSRRIPTRSVAHLVQELN